jgi:hypothetical protein
VFRFSDGMENEVIASCFLVGLAGAFIFAIFRSFAAPS